MIRVHLIRNSESVLFENGWSYEFDDEGRLGIYTKADKTIATFCPGEVSWAHDLHPEDE